LQQQHNFSRRGACIQVKDSGRRDSRLIDRRNLLKTAAVFVASASTLQTPASFASSGAEKPDIPTTPFNKRMVGFMLAHEQFPVPQLVEIGVLAEQAGFDLLATSDHLQPWQSNEGHSGSAWATLAAVGQKTRRVWMGPTVTCPTFRYNPAVVAEAFASLSLLTPGRIFLGIGLTMANTAPVLIVSATTAIG
jgi:hypothetical protein